MRGSETVRTANAARETLSRERIELAALDLIDAEGPSGFSTRRLAAALGCEAMSIYHYFPSKGHLLDALVDRAVDDVALPDAALPWIERLRQLGYEVRRAFTRRPGLFAFLGTHRLSTAKGLALLNKIILLCEDSGLGHEQSVRVFRAVSHYLMGAGLNETAAHTRGASTADPVPLETMRAQYRAVLDAGRFFQPADFDRSFAMGWELMLSGIEQLRLQSDA
jgi:AcrR family transcriptional regulator